MHEVLERRFYEKRVWIYYSYTMSVTYHVKLSDANLKYSRDNEKYTINELKDKFVPRSVANLT